MNISIPTARSAYVIAVAMFDICGVARPPPPRPVINF
jgi:hypothetical protein